MMPTPKDATHLANEVHVFNLDAMTDPNAPEEVLEVGQRYEKVLRDYAKRLRA